MKAEDKIAKMEEYIYRMDEHIRTMERRIEAMERLWEIQQENVARRMNERAWRAESRAPQYERIPGKHLGDRWNDDY